MVKHNNVIPNIHFHKDWQTRVKTWFNQPGRKQRRRRNRMEKARRVFPRPTQKLRPVVQCPTIKYNSKQRLGRGFTLDELEKAEISPIFARTIGIAVDHRRKNRSEETLNANVKRLEQYKAKLVLFPKQGKKAGKNEASQQECENASQVSGSVLRFAKNVPQVQFRAITEEDKKKSAFKHIAKTRREIKKKRNHPKISRD
eukprot:TRINITY_DN5738_c0_g1_i1.p1 TRINITY_DN5738_c0_g1~~TRINITY_DN5738_c0_g1_i1.p1  ORF type:complete len:200 (-),score=52.17 TRINITY_DN5738_c0_g1_i1:82-681(-)